MLKVNKWTTFTKIYTAGVARVQTVVSGAFYYRLDVSNLCKLYIKWRTIYGQCRN